MKNAFEAPLPKQEAVAHKNIPETSKDIFDQTLRISEQLTAKRAREELLTHIAVEFLKEDKPNQAHEIVDSLSSVQAKIDGQAMLVGTQKEEEKSSDEEMQRLEDLEHVIEDESSPEERNRLSYSFAMTWNKLHEYSRAKALLYSLDATEIPKEKNPFRHTASAKELRERGFVQICVEQSASSIPDAKKTLELITAPQEILRASVAIAKTALKNGDPVEAWNILRDTPESGREVDEAAELISKLMEHPTLQQKEKNTMKEKLDRLIINNENDDRYPDSGAEYWAESSIDALERIGRFDLIRQKLQSAPKNALAAVAYANEGRESLAFIAAESIQDPEIRTETIKKIEALISGSSVEASTGEHPYRAQKQSGIRRMDFYTRKELMVLIEGYEEAVGKDIRDGRDPSISFEGLREIFRDPECKEKERDSAARMLACIEAFRGNSEEALTFVKEISKSGTREAALFDVGMTLLEGRDFERKEKKKKEVV